MLEPENESTEHIHPVALGLLAFCQVNIGYFRQKGMEFEAQVFENGMKRVQERFGVESKNLKLDNKSTPDRTES